MGEKNGKKYIEYYTLTLLRGKEKVIDEYVKDEKIKKEQEKYKERIRELEEKNRKQEEELNCLKKQKQEAKLEHQRKEKELRQKLQEDEVRRQEQLKKEYVESKLQEDLKREREKEKNSDGRSTEKEKTKKKTPAGTIIMVILVMCIVLGIVLVSQNGKGSADNNATTSSKASETKEESQKSEVNVGDTVTFGTYDNTDIQWTVLDKEDNKALLITQNCLLDKKYNEELEAVTWEECTLRNWLNKDFYKNSFSETERKQIVETTLTNSANPVYDTEGGNNTKDKVFLLSIDEANKYFSSDDERKATSADGMSKWWWLRSPGYYLFSEASAAYVHNDGYVNERGNCVDDKNGRVRPALWVNLDSVLF